MYYELLKKVASVCFNLLNRVLMGNLPPFACVCIIAEQDGSFLVLERSLNSFSLPGGFMRWNEHPSQTLAREGKEETGLDLRPVQIIGHYSLPTDHPTRMSILTLIYHAEVTGGTLHTSVEGRPRWIPEAELQPHIDPFFQMLLDAYKNYRQSPTSHAFDVELTYPASHADKL